MQKYSILEHGVTQSMLLNFLKCRESMRLSLSGWSGAGVSPAMQYGELFHGTLERVFKSFRSGKIDGMPNDRELERIVNKVAKGLEREFDGISDDEYGILGYNKALALAQLPVYFDHHKKDFQKREWKLLETEFCVPVKIKVNGVSLAIPFRGKIDGGYMQDGKFYLFETKTKSRIDIAALIDQLHFDFQTSSYVFASQGMGLPFPRGILYNVIRKPELRQRKTEDLGLFMKRVRADCNARRREYYYRWNIAITEKEINKFIEEFKGIVKDFYLWHTGKIAHYRNTGACQDKFGACRFIGVCSRQDYSRLKQRDKIFPELGGV